MGWARVRRVRAVASEISQIPKDTGLNFASARNNFHPAQDSRRHIGLIYVTENGLRRT